MTPDKAKEVVRKIKPLKRRKSFTHQAIQTAMAEDVSKRIETISQHSRQIGDVTVNFTIGRIK